MDEKKDKTLIREREKARNGRVFCTQKFRFWCLTTIIIIFDTPRHTTTNWLKTKKQNNGLLKENRESHHTFMS